MKAKKRKRQEPTWSVSVRLLPSLRRQRTVFVTSRNDVQARIDAAELLAEDGDGWVIDSVQRVDLDIGQAAGDELGVLRELADAVRVAWGRPSAPSGMGCSVEVNPREEAVIHRSLLVLGAMKRKVKKGVANKEQGVAVYVFRPGGEAGGNVYNDPNALRAALDAGKGPQTVIGDWSSLPKRLRDRCGWPERDNKS
jgi:hypothetical protein